VWLALSEVLAQPVDPVILRDLGLDSEAVRRPVSVFYFSEMVAGNLRTLPEHVFRVPRCLCAKRQVVNELKETDTDMGVIALE